VRLQLLCELVPGVTKIGALRCDSRPDAAVQKTILDNKALALGVGPLNYRSIDPNGTTQDADIERAFQEWKAAGVKAVIVTADPLFNNHMDTIVGAAAQRKIPAVYQWREFADQGGLMGYGPSLSLAYKIAGTFAGRIAEELATIEELPLLSLESCELVINLKAAKDLSLTVPPALLARATDVIVE
jgi:putative ABC transport system substrate-binding protein